MLKLLTDFFIKCWRSLALPSTQKPIWNGKMPRLWFNLGQLWLKINLISIWYWFYRWTEKSMVEQQSKTLGFEGGQRQTCVMSCDEAMKRWSDDALNINHFYTTSICWGFCTSDWPVTLIKLSIDCLEIGIDEKS